MSVLLKYDFCEIEVFSNYLIVTISEGITLTPQHNQVLKDISLKHFKDKKFGYITHRVHSYSVDPRIYIETSKIENLAAFAIVSTRQINISNAEIEKLFFKKPFKHFDVLENAIAWVKGYSK